MGARDNPLRQLLNTSVEQAPTTSAEIRRRLATSASRQHAIADTEHAVGATATEPAPQQAPSSEPVRPEGGAPAPAPPAVIGKGEGEEPLALGEVAAQLAERAERFEEFEARLAAERISVDALEGRLRMVVAGDGTPVSLDVDPASLRGPEARRLGGHIANLILTARQQADVLRTQLEDDFHRLPAMPTEQGPRP
ncbi:hypothetical protein [Actinomadura nitritigenes]|uniref:hypothetical protein n=1 Tax=Actinomadura nitritigenes TaxID=134602 RepID=UPI003D94CC01